MSLQVRSTVEPAETLVVGDLHFELRRSPRRRTVQVTVDRGGELVIATPDACSTKAMKDFVREKRFWIYTKLAEKEALHSVPPLKEYVSGEGFPYLGRNYRLLLVERQSEPVKLDAGRFKMTRSAAATGRQHMLRWYTQRGSVWLNRRVAQLQHRAGAAPSAVQVRDLGYRWGSCTKAGAINFHWQTLLLPPSVIDYIIVHELVHLCEPHHTPEFWTRVERAMPDFARRKQWLAANGALAGL